MHMKYPNLTGVRGPKKNTSHCTREDALFYTLSCERDSHTHATRRRKVSLNNSHYALNVYWVKLLLYQRVSLIKQLFKHEVGWLARATCVNMRVFRSCIYVQTLGVSRAPSVKRLGNARRAFACATALSPRHGSKLTRGRDSRVPHF